MSHELVRALFVIGLLVGIIPVMAVTAAPPAPVTAPAPATAPGPATAPAPVAAVAATMDDTLDPSRAGRFSDPIAKLSFTPPPGWVPAPLTSLDPPSSPALPVFEIARFQLRVKDPALYAQPVPLTSGLIDRRLVMQAVASAEDWPGLQPAILAAMRSLRADQVGPHGPVAPPPAPPIVAPAPEAAAAVEPVPDASAQKRFDILTRASALLGTPYLWGGNTPNRSMDCSAYVSWVWGLSRYTTDSIWAVSHHILKEELRPGDAMNLTIGNDPQRFGHIRIFEAWANEQHTIMWVYEETPPRAVHRVIAYDARYQPIRLNGVSGEAPVALVPAPPSAVQRTDNVGLAAAPRQAPRATPRPTEGPTNERGGGPEP